MSSLRHLDAYQLRYTDPPKCVHFFGWSIRPDVFVIFLESSTLGALRQTVGIKTATKARCEIIPSPVLSSDIHYQNYGHHGLFPVITLRLAGAGLAIGRLFWWPGLNSQ